MKVKKVPMRSCVVTKERCEKKDLIRIVKTPDNKVIVDLTGKQNGHGAYVKKELGVIEKAEENKILDRILNTDVPSEIYEELKNICK